MSSEVITRMPVMKKQIKKKQFRMKSLTTAAGCLLVTTMSMYSHADLSYNAPNAATSQSTVNPEPILEEGILSGFYPSLTIGAYTHSDPLRDTDGPIEDSDFEIVIQPALLYKTNLGRHPVQIRYGATLNSFNDLSNENVSSQSLDGAINLDLTEKADLDLFAGVANANEGRGTSGSRLFQSVEQDEVDIARYGGALTLGRPQSRLQVSIGAQANERRYKNNNQEIRDRDRKGIVGTVSYNIGLKSRAFIRASKEDIDYESDIQNGGSFNLDSEQTNVGVGFGWDVTARTRGEIGIFKRERDFEVGGFEDPDQTGYRGTLTYKLKPYSTVTLYANRDYEETTERPSSYIDSRVLGAAWNHALTDRLGLTAFYNDTRNNYTVIRKDKIKDYGIGLDYDFRQWLNIGAQYGVFERESNTPEANFEDKIFSIRARFSPRLGQDVFNDKTAKETREQ